SCPSHSPPPPHHLRPPALTSRADALAGDHSPANQTTNHPPTSSFLGRRRPRRGDLRWLLDSRSGFAGSRRPKGLACVSLPWWARTVTRPQAWALGAVAVLALVACSPSEPVPSPSPSSESPSPSESRSVAPSLEPSP